MSATTLDVVPVEIEPVPLPTRMKAYETTHRTTVPRDEIVVIRVDGRAFSTYTRGLERPFDAAFAADMNAVALDLAKSVDGTLIAYVQSDEVSLIVGPPRDGKAAWMGGVVAKIVSLTASRATATMALRQPPTPDRVAMFDSRLFTISEPYEAANYLVWRQQDAARNAVSMAVTARFRHSELAGVDVPGRRAMLADVGIDFDAYPVGFRRGRVVIQRSVRVPVTNPKPGEPKIVTRYRWVVEDAPVFDARESGWLVNDVLPHPEGFIRFGRVGGLIASGEVVRTASGRLTTPFPQVDVTTERKTGNTLRRVETWLMDNARAEADARGLPLWVSPKAPYSASDKDTAEAMLFDQSWLSFEPRQSLLRPLTVPEDD